MNKTANKTALQRISAVLAILGYSTKEKRTAMTNEDWNKFQAEYKKKYGTDFQEDLDKPDEEETPPVGADPQGSISPEIREQILGALEGASEATGQETPENVPDTVEGATGSLISALNMATETIRTLGRSQENDRPAAVITGAGFAMTPQTMAVVMGHAPHTATHVFGIENDYFKRGSWWNDLVVSGEGKEDYRDEDATSFRAAFNNFAKDFKARCTELAKSNQIGLLDYNKMIRGESYLDYSKMNSKLGEYIVRRMDTIIAYLRTLKSVAGIFPLVSNVQNKKTAPTAFFKELSQSYKSGHHFKGAVNFGGEIYHVDDVMFKFAFDDPKQLEKEYIGYMNREGSNPMKWTLFEWCIVHFGTLLFNEQQRRRVVGAKVPRQGDFPQPAMRGADGALRAIQRVEEERKVLPFQDLKIYDRSTMVDYVETFYEKVMGILPNMEGYLVYANEKHKPWYLKGFREKYGKDTDFTGTKENIADLSPANIVWVPNMGMNDYKMWIVKPGNVENYENKPNEMYGFYFQQDLEQLILASWWKEGSGVLAPGVQFNTLEDLEKSGRRMQWLFTNYPVVTLDPDETVIDGLAGFEIETAENTAATVITDIENASIERVYKIICGSLTNKSTIAKIDKFAGITAAWSPNAIGDYIKVYAELREDTVIINGEEIKEVVHTGNFLELERKVTN